MLKIFKFGGASIKDVKNIQNTGSIINKYSSESLVIVFSAMGKVTNMLETVVEAFISVNENAIERLEIVRKFHYSILNELFDDKNNIYNEVDNIFTEVEWVLEENQINTYSYYYDQIVSVGELLSTKIMSAYLEQLGIIHNWIDARDIIRTNNTYRNAKVDWETTSKLICNKIREGIYVTQGFVGSTSENYTTTLGREGSDFTSAILAFSLSAKEVIIWKDVPGMMSADPKKSSSAVLFNQISFDEAIELAFFGAKVIHPKTIQPLKAKNISLRIRSFLELNNKGTKISEGVLTEPKVPSYIIKANQVLISISDTKLSFIVENHISQIFYLLDKHLISVNMMQNSAISFSICIDNDKQKIPFLINDLRKQFKVYYNDNLSLYTIRHYKVNSINELLKGRTVMLEQRSRNTMQIVA